MTDEKRVSPFVTGLGKAAGIGVFAAAAGAVNFATDGALDPVVKTVATCIGIVTGVSIGCGDHPLSVGAGALTGVAGLAALVFVFDSAAAPALSEIPAAAPLSAPAAAGAYRGVPQPPVSTRRP